jgi:hypothetical protein
MMKYDMSDPTKFVKKSKAEFKLVEVEGTRTYLFKPTNSDMYGDDTYSWNAPLQFKDENGKARKVWGFSDNYNFSREVLEVSDGKDKEDDEMELPESDKRLITSGVNQKYTLLYTPLMTTPGWYTVRYCMDDLEVKDDEYVANLTRKRLALSPKSYYYDRSVLSSDTITTDILTSTLATEPNVGSANFLRFFEIINGIIDLTYDDAKRERNTMKLKDLLQHRQRLNVLAEKSKAASIPITVGTDALPTAVGSPTAEGSAIQPPKPPTKAEEKAAAKNAKLTTEQLIEQSVQVIKETSKRLRGPKSPKVQTFVQSKQAEVRTNLLGVRHALGKLQYACELNTLNLQIKDYLDAQLVKIGLDYHSENTRVREDAIEAAENTYREWKGLILLEKALLPDELSDIFDDVESLVTKNPVEYSQSSWLYASNRDKGKYVTVRILMTICMTDL